MARPVSAFEKATRWCRRNKLAAALILAFTLAVVAGTTGTGIAAYFATRRASEAEEARGKADERTRYAREQEEKTSEAKKQVEIERDQVRSALYETLVIASDRAFDRRELTDAARYLDECPEPLRKFEWFVRRANIEGATAVLNNGAFRGQRRVHVRWEGVRHLRRARQTAGPLPRRDHWPTSRRYPHASQVYGSCYVCWAQPRWEMGRGTLRHGNIVQSGRPDVRARWLRDDSRLRPLVRSSWHLNVRAPASLSALTEVKSQLGMTKRSRSSISRPAQSSAQSAISKTLSSTSDGIRMGKW